MTEPLRTHEEAMLMEAKAWRASLRAQLGVRCRDPREGGRCDHLSGVHEPGCWWEYAMNRVYELERALGL